MSDPHRTAVRPPPADDLIDAELAPGKAARPTPLRRFVREECANYISGECFAQPCDECLVIEGKRCPYFEGSVFPIATRKIRLLRKNAKHDDRDIVKAYLRDHSELRGTLVPEPDDDGVRSCPDCGSPLGPCMRYCQACRAKRRRQSDRRQKARTRGGCPTVNSEKGGQNRLF